MMCFLRLEDYSHNIRVVVFPKVFYASMHNTEPDTAVVIIGRVDFSDDERDKIQLVADSIIPMEEYMPDYYIALRPEQEKPEIYQALQEIFQQHHGNCVVYIYYYGTKKLTMNEKKYWLDGSQEAVDKIKKLLGEDNIRQR